MAWLVTIIWELPVECLKGRKSPMSSKQDKISIPTEFWE